MTAAAPHAGGQTRGGSPAASGRTGRSLARSPLLTAVGCVAGGALSLLVLPPGLGSDTWAWLVWGREVLGLALDPTNGPSWKPLPVLFTTPLALAGDAAPVLWTVVARAGVLLALAFAYRVAARAAGPLAGAFGVLALLATDLVDLAASGDSEPLATAFLLWALERHLEGRRGQALALLALAALGRPEAWVILVAYAAFAVGRERRLLPVAAVSAIVPPLLWLGPPWLATGDPLSAGERANRVTEASLATADVPALAVAAKTVELAGLPVLVAALGAVCAVLVPAVRRRFPALADGGARTPVLALAGGMLAWVALVAALTQAGFTGNERYLFPAVAAVCALGGAGAGIAVRAMGGGRRWRTAAAALAVLLIAAPFGLSRAREALGYRAEASERARTIAGLGEALARAGGRDRVLACGSPAVTRPGTQGTLAWALGVPLSAVARTWPPDPRLELRPPALVFSRTERRFDLLAARGMLAPGLVAEPLPWRAQRWRTFSVADGTGAARAAAARCRAR